MATVRNDWDVARICPTLGFHEVEPGGTITVPDGEIEHWVAGGWVPADQASTELAQAAASARAAAFEALLAAESKPPALAPATPAAAAVSSTPAVAPAKPIKDAAPSAAEGKQP